MDTKKFFSLFKEGVNDFYRNPRVLISGLVLWGFVFLISRGAARVGQTQQTVFGAYGIFVFIILVLLSVLSFIFSGLIGMSKEIVQKKKKRGFFSYSNKFWLRNLLILAVIIVISVLIGRVAHYGAFFIGRIFSLGLGMAQFVFVLIYFIGLIGVLIWFTFSNFLLVFEDLSVIGGIKRSFSFVKKDYLGVLALNVVFFVLVFLLDRIPGFFGELVEYLILLPYAALVLSRFVLRK